jgi:hypothetical protein
MIMRVYALVRINTVADDDSGTKFGDIIAVHRTDRLNNKQIEKHPFHVFVYIPLDINIPCGNEFEIERWGKCGECPNNDPGECDVQKYVRALWSEGDVNNPPRVLSKSRYRIGIGSALSAASLTVVTKENKTATDVQNIIILASSLPTMNAYIEDKAEL